MSDTPDWRRMTPHALHAAYDSAAAVPETRTIVDSIWGTASARLRAARPEHLDIPYGEGARQRWDFFPAADPAAPCMVFIHGGYWQRNGREGFACMAEGALARGWSAALPSHTLAPEATMTRIVAELRTAMDMLAARGPSHGLAAGRVVLSGWSAGGHLAALLADHPAVHAAMAVSGIFDLEPIRGTRLNDALQLTPTEIETFSPHRLPMPRKPLAVAYGTAELPELQRQSLDHHARRAAAGLAGPLMPLPGAHHFGVLNVLRDANGALLGEMQRMLDK